MKKTYKGPSEKYQVAESVDSFTLTFPVRHVLASDVHVEYFDNFVKVNVRKNNYVEVVDFPRNLDFQNGKNSAQLLDNCLEVLVMKDAAEQEMWETIKVEGSRGELIKRREVAMQRKQDFEAQQYKAAEAQKHELDRVSVKKQMEVESFQRKQIKEKKKVEKDAAVNEMQADLDEIEKNYHNPKAPQTLKERD